jgi:hypothetical protein
MRSDGPPRRALLVLTAVVCVGGCHETPTTPSAPVTLSQLSLMPTAVVAGATSDGTATLSGRAPSGGSELRLASSDGAATVPPSIIVPAGSTSVTFTVQTRLVAADTSATISALMGAEKREVALRVTAPIARPPSLQALEVEPAVFRGGQNTQGSVRLTGAAPAGGFLVNLRSSNSVASVPGTVTVPAGVVSATFTVTTRPVSLETQFEITASFGDQTHTVAIRLTP